MILFRKLWTLLLQLGHQKTLHLVSRKTMRLGQEWLVLCKGGKLMLVRIYLSILKFSNQKLYVCILIFFYAFFSPTSNGNACRTSRSDFFLSTSRLRSVSTLCQKSQRRRELHCIHRISAFCVLDLYCNIWLFSSIISICYK